MPITLHDHYLYLYHSENRYFLLGSGRGSGKSYGVSTFASQLSYEPGQKILIARWTMKSASISIIPEFMEKIDTLEEEGHIENATQHFDHKVSDDLVINNQSGSEILFRGIKTSSGNQTANLKSINGITTLIIEEAEELIDEDTFDKIDNSIRMIGKHLRVIIIWNPTNTKHWIYRRFWKENKVKYDWTGEKNGYTYIYTTYLDNAKNLDKSFLDKAERMKSMNPKRYRNIYLGEPTDETENALWSQYTMIDPFRVTINDVPDDIKRVVVAVDPNVTSSETADECGIVVECEDFNKNYYTLKDLSGKYSPSEWARVVVGAYKTFDADCVVAEVNNGGDLVVMAIKNIDPSVYVKTVRASKGKMVRAEPIAALYEEGRVHHVGVFDELEEEMTTYTGDPKDKSPNRLDAKVWGLHELSQGYNPTPSIRRL